MSLPQNNNKINSFNKLNIPAKFDSNTVSNVPSFTYLEAAKSIIDFKSLISDNISYQKAANATYQPADILDFDDTVCTVFGNQEGSANGYNPRYKGRPSFKEKVGIISKTDELLNLTMEEGTHHSNHEFLRILY